MPIYFVNQLYKCWVLPSFRNGVVALEWLQSPRCDHACHPSMVLGCCRLPYFPACFDLRSCLLWHRLAVPAMPHSYLREECYLGGFHWSQPLHFQGHQIVMVAAVWTICAHKPPKLFTASNMWQVYKLFFDTEIRVLCTTSYLFFNFTSGGSDDSIKTVTEIGRRSSTVQETTMVVKMQEVPNAWWGEIMWKIKQRENILQVTGNV